jgi:hypothetical protein
MGALRRRDALILNVLAHHSGQNFAGVRSDISWGPVFSRDPATLIPGIEPRRGTSRLGRSLVGRELGDEANPGEKSG